ncbi:hypothetical protein C0992_009025 [Termitomyces sp. T32_za158]|nr:hypothetical protein C0992_009025 [Termitomyces sp. T32_za158]
MKRAAPSTTTSAPKKTRFLDPADDDPDDDALENTSHRRNRVRTDGYDSDSSDDGEGVVPSRKRGSAADNEDDVDMFSLADTRASPTKKKKHEFLRLGDIEGQEFTDSASASSDDSEPEDEDDAARRKKAGMGYEMSSFNMRDEMEEGKFTDDGTYVRSVDVHAAHDKWMDGLSEREIKLARRRKRMHDRSQRDKIQAEERELHASGGMHNLEKELLPLLKKGETVLEALHRLGVLLKKSQSQSLPHAHAHSAAHVEKITHLASNIMALGESDIYSKTYEELVRSVRASGAVDTAWVPPSADVRYEYKWDVPGPNGPPPAPDQVFGPFSEDEMKAWMKASYFGVAGEKIKVRPVDGDWADWDDVFQ